MENIYSDIKERISQAAKNANGKQWYKDHCDIIDNRSFSKATVFGYGDTEYRRKKANYNLFNNIINEEDFYYITKPMGSEVGELPANFTNRDIVSPKLKVLHGLELKRPFSWRVIAKNPEATTRKEQTEFGMYKDYVVNQIVLPIKQQLEQQYSTNQPLTPQQQEEINQRIAQELEAKTPEEVKKYMERDHQDPAEVMASQLLTYLIEKTKFKQKANTVWKHGTISADMVYYVGVMNGEPVVYPINSLYFDYDKSRDNECIEDGEWAICEYAMTPSKIVSLYGRELTNKQIDDIYSDVKIGLSEDNFFVDDDTSGHTLRVIHTVWKSLRKIGFLSYNYKGRILEKLVDETYKLDKSNGDIGISWMWVPETHEATRIGRDIYVNMGPVPNQFKTEENLYECKLPYIGISFDSLNGEATSPMDRVKTYQYYYDIVMYRIEMLMASDKGKLLFLNPKMIPKSLGIDMKLWHYYAEATKIGWLNPDEEGNRGMQSDVTNLVKEIDLSLASDIQKYINFAEYLEKKCGDVIGITKQMEGDISPNEAVQNTRQSITQSSHILEPYFELHNEVKKNVLTALLNAAKIAYGGKRSVKLSYVLDDMSVRMLEINGQLLEDSDYGIFVSNSSRAAEAKQLIQDLAHAAMQTQRADLSDIIKVVKAEGLQEAEEQLIISEKRKTKELQQAEERKLQLINEDKEKERQHDLNVENLKHSNKIKEIEKEGEIDIKRQVILAAGFNEDKDINDNNVLDVVEIAKLGLDAELGRKKLDIENEKVNIMKTKPAQSK